MIDRFDDGLVICDSSTELSRLEFPSVMLQKKKGEFTGYAAPLAVRVMSVPLTTVEELPLKNIITQLLRCWKYISSADEVGRGRNDSFDESVN